jgi:hypothetical protein
MITIPATTIGFLLSREFGLPLDLDANIKFLTTSGQSVEIKSIVLCPAVSTQCEFNFPNIASGGLNSPINLRVFMIQSVETLGLSNPALSRIKKLNILKVWQLIALYDLLPSRKIPPKKLVELNDSLHRISGYNVHFRELFGKWFVSWVSFNSAFSDDNYFSWLSVLSRDDKLSISVDDTIFNIVPTIQRET